MQKSNRRCEHARIPLAVTPETRRNADGREVDVNRVENIFGIAAGHHECDRFRGGAAQGQMAMRSRLCVTFLRQCQPAETIIAVVIGAREIVRKFGLRRRQRMGNAPFQCIEIVGIACAIRQFDVEIDGFLAKRKVPGAEVLTSASEGRSLPATAKRSGRCK